MSFPCIVWTTQSSSFSHLRMMVDIRGSQCSSVGLNTTQIPVNFSTFFPPYLKNRFAVMSALLYRTFALSEPCKTTLPVMPQQASLTPGQRSGWSNWFHVAPDLCALVPGQHMERRMHGKEKLKMALTFSLSEADRILHLFRFLSLDIYQ